MDNVANIIVKIIDKATSPIKRINKAIDSATAPARRMNRTMGDALAVSGWHKVSGAVGMVGNRINGVTAATKQMAAKMVVAGGIATYLFKSQLLDSAALFERYSTILTTLENNDPSKARASMEWISDFAAKTPYELDQVVASFVKLRTYGLDPTNGLLKTLGDTSAAMGKDLNQAVEAIADAMTGENERLKEFGIKARVMGKKIVYEYSANGKTMRKAAKVGNREMIQSTLEAIWNEKYAGQMDKMSSTWDGMLSNMSDWWLRFRLMIMEAGAFDFLKGKLKGLLDTLNQMASSGELKKIATDFGVRLVDALKKLWEAGKAVAAVASVLFGVLSSVAEVLGGWENLGYVIAALFGLKLVAAVASLAMALQGLGVALLTTPIGWFIGIVAALAAVAVLIYTKWEPIKAFFEGFWESLKMVVAVNISAITGFVKDMWNGIKADFMAGINWITDKMAVVTDLMPDWMTGANEQAAPSTPRGPMRRTRQRSDRQSQIGGALHIKIDSEGRPKVAKLKSDNPNFDLNVDAGLVMGGM